MTLGTDLLLCTSKTCCLHGLTQPGKDQEALQKSWVCFLLVGFDFGRVFYL